MGKLANGNLSEGPSGGQGSCKHKQDGCLPHTYSVSESSGRYSYEMLGAISTGKAALGSPEPLLRRFVGRAGNISLVMPL